MVIYIDSPRFPQNSPRKCCVFPLPNVSPPPSLSGRCGWSWWFRATSPGCSSLSFLAVAVYIYYICYICVYYIYYVWNKLIHIYIYYNYVYIHVKNKKPKNVGEWSSFPQMAMHLFVIGGWEFAITCRGPRNCVFGSGLYPLHGFWRDRLNFIHWNSANVAKNGHWKSLKFTSDRRYMWSKTK